MQWTFLHTSPPEPDSYPTHVTPIFTPEGPTTMERSRTKKMEKEEK